MYHDIGELDNALEKHQQSLEMELVIHGHRKPHPDIASSLNHLGIVYEAIGEIENALEMSQQGLEMHRAIHGSDKPHPDTANALQCIGSVYQKQKTELRRRLSRAEY